MDTPWYAHYEPSVPRKLTYQPVTLNRMFEDTVQIISRP